MLSKSLQQQNGGMESVFVGHQSLPTVQETVSGSQVNITFRFPPLCCDHVSARHCPPADTATSLQLPDWALMSKMHSHPFPNKP